MIYLCRHGQTVSNREGRIQGQLESPLTPLGRKQAAAMAARLYALIGDPQAWRLCASPLGRARETAEIIGARLGLPVALDDRLMEVHVGGWQGMMHKALSRAHPETMDDRLWCFRGPGGETYDELMARVSAWLTEQAPEPGRRVIVVSHGVAGRLLRAAYAGLEPQAAMRQDIPQDAFFRLSGRQIERIATPLSSFA